MERIVKKREVGICLCMIFLLLVVGYLFNEINPYPSIEFVLEDAVLGDSFSIFYLDRDMENFDESHKISDTITSRPYKCNFVIQDSHMSKDKFRIDIGSSVGNIRISSVIMKSLFMKKEISPQFMANCNFSKDIGKVYVDRDMLSVESIGNDPYIILDELNEVESKIYWNLYNILLTIFGAIIVIFGMLIKESEKKIGINKRHAFIISLVLFLTHRIIFFAKHIGFFAFDEFFHISTLNPDYITDYDRAVYINYLEKVICKIFGQSDLTVKLVPFFLGVVSFLCCLYLCYQLYDNPYWIITICAIITYMPYIVFNHFYIRMYIFLETLLMLDCVLLYNAQRRVGTRSEKLNLLFCGIITGLYSLYTKDLSGKAIIVLLMVAILYHFWRNRKRDLCDRRLIFKIGGGLFCIGSIVTILIVKLRGWEIFERIFTAEYEYRDESPVFVKFVLVTIFYITIPFIISLIYTCKKTEYNNSLYIIASLPLFGYTVIFYNAHMIRNYAAFLPIICIMAYLAFDKIRLSAMQHLIIILCMIGLTVHIEPDFWQYPSISRETSYGNLGAAVSRAKEVEEQGYELVALLPTDLHLAYFDLLDRVRIEDSDGLVDEVEPMFKSDRKIVFVADARGLGYLNHTDWTTWAKNKCVVESFAGESCVIILN